LLATSKNIPHVECGFNVQNFHGHGFSMPDAQEPIAPETEITERKLMSHVALKNLQH
jgi:hypothetical protein